ncbi:MAG: amidohydrolase family protein [bacterium]
MIIKNRIPRSRKVAQVAVYLVAIVLFVSCNGTREENMADLILKNGNIITIDDSIPNAQAIAIKGDKILFVGSNEEIENFIGDSTETIDLDGKFVMPGFFESHAHFLGVGQSKLILDLTIARNWDEVVAMVAKAAELSNPGEWILGRGWHQEKFDPPPIPSVEGYPIHRFLTDASPNNPVILFHASGHAIFANAKQWSWRRLIPLRRNLQVAE